MWRNRLQRQSGLPLTPGHYAVICFLCGWLLFVRVVDFTFNQGWLVFREMTPAPFEFLLLGFLPNILRFCQEYWQVVLVLTALAAGCLSLAVGLGGRWLALFVGYGLLCAFHGGYLKPYHEPGMLYIGWLLLVMMLAPPRLVFRDRRYRQRLCRLYQVSLFLLAVGYGVGGLLLFWPEIITYAAGFLGAFPYYSLQQAAAAVLPPHLAVAVLMVLLALQAIYPLLGLHHLGRKWLWLALLLMQLGVWWLSGLRYDNLGLLLLHFATFDCRWWAPRHQDAAPILFFDGHCNLCNSAVALVLAEDQQQLFKYAPLTGITAQKMLPQATLAGDSVVVLTPQGPLAKSAAAIYIAEGLGGMWRLASLGRWLPVAWRDGAYDVLARHRYRLFGKRDTCRLPEPHERGLFLP